MSFESLHLRNIAIIAHVDHGKTTLVDTMFRQSGVFRPDQEVAERIMDSMDIERERGITIAAKNCSVRYGDTKINILDTPGHADFGAEVERALSMVDGAILLVDAAEGPLPQTRFVLKKTFEAHIPVIVAINKVDRQDARPQEVLNEIYDLFIDLEATETQIEFPCLYTIGRDGRSGPEPDKLGDDLSLLFETILSHIPPPKVNPDGPFSLLVSDIGYSDYLGRLAIGMIRSGTLKSRMPIVRANAKGQLIPFRLSTMQVYEGTQLTKSDMASAGEIVVLSGNEDVEIGDTLTLADTPLIQPRIRVDEPTVAMRFTINNSPLSGREGTLVQSRKIRERLEKETLRNVAIQIENTDDKDTFLVKGRGEFQMAILIETMRREGFELCVGRPEVIFREENGVRLEPMEDVYIDCDETFMGVVTEKMSIRKSRMESLVNNGSGRVRMHFIAPSRALIGYRDEFLTDTRGTGILNALFAGYEPYRGDFPSRFTGSLVSDRSGVAIPYALFNLEPRGVLFITPGSPVYTGMVIGIHAKDNDLDVNPCKEKKLTNMRASGKDDNVTLRPVKPMTLEAALQFIAEDELVEVTPLSIRLRKTYLNYHDRQKNKKQKTS
ncbi:translational GTPase TypA [Desulfobotulus sp. H1]|uniref:Large ribosomal subunit assembly factor BipA n=1 Tax=Desulfobotulus pelophilus TaxID=2823377 RepID=A0ABT3N8G4_9BACT|nr:translational GTPase TypA [Desulfobotulus pelophilus]MCW7753734.1 translational GTPase TypA [Desulfobotulus pelophilus]